MSQERRRYFRCTAEVPVFITRVDGKISGCKTANISANGLSITSSESFAAGERIEVALQLGPNTDQVRAHGTVVWDDKHGKTGISMQCVAAESQTRLNSWLDDHFANLRHSPTNTADEPAAVTSGRS